ncbi:hypothetical protein L227DRAFT_15318 [Lentinus tigrinus ALCF2SS1-6]|uniref:Uncharacterized protein n=1 Tax=Lentinus tigrinus ALCF2SS1-6 TaxID=1328759 RepID=A0A5C2SWF2_9APHY|nr:hypothetical protein L227DRAFT_15318 [Lentinus tigrinus ALCF2SS1-6]
MSSTPSTPCAMSSSTNPAKTIRRGSTCRKTSCASPGTQLAGNPCSRPPKCPAFLPVLLYVHQAPVSVRKQ